MTIDTILNAHPPVLPKTRMLWTAVVTVGEKQDLGPYNGGHRYLVPITGGDFVAGPDAEGLSGTVLAGGADRQFLRPDGAKELDAIYEMQITDGPVISIRNRVIVDQKPGGGNYAMSRITARVEDGPFGWLNRRVLVGTLQSLRPQQPQVIIRAWLVDT